MSSDARAFEAGDDGFHEIQLNGKQLVFLGMATTLVSVVIFLCGVLVGRGVKPLDTVAQAGGPQPFDASASLSSTPSPASVPPGTVSAPAAPAAAVPALAAPAARTETPAGDTEPTPVGDEAEATPDAAAPPAAAATAKPTVPAVAKPPVREAAKPAPKPSVVTPAPAQATATPPAPHPAPAAPATTAAAAAAPASGGAIAVQVGAFKTRGEADGLARRLSGKGYAVYVMSPTGDGKNVYRVRVGNFSTADEAQRVSARLTDQEKLKPWITH